MPATGPERPPAGAQLVTLRPDDLERCAGRETDLKLHALDVVRGGQPVPVAVDASATRTWPRARCVPAPAVDAPRSRACRGV